MVETPRLYYRHTRTGDLGYLVQKDGRDFIAYDRAGDPILKVFKHGDWIAEAEPRPLSAVAIARVAYDADAALCIALGLPKQKPWLSLLDDERIQFMQHGPPSAVRQGLYLVITAYARGLGG
jgi:hypothetical protein